MPAHTGRRARGRAHERGRHGDGERERERERGGPLYFPTLCIPQFDGFVFTAAGKHGSVGAPRNRSDTVRVPVDRTRGIGLLRMTIVIKGAGTIRVVFAANCSKS